jgi:beta-1,4-N-acetylglucosaminyltransferase
LSIARGPCTLAGSSEMIFVTVGSTDFDGLVRAVDDLAPRLQDRIIMQIGLGRYEPKHAEYVRFAPSLEGYFRDADLIIGHGGYGTIVEALDMGRKLVCVVNPTTYDRHQEHLLTVFERRNHLIWCRDLGQLDEAIEQARASELAPYQPPPCRIHEEIARFLAR